MSAYVVGKTHIDALVTAGLRSGAGGSPLRWLAPVLEDQSGAYRRGEPWGPDAIRLYNARRRELTPETADRVGQMLWAENVQSVNHRYDEDRWEELYVYRPFPHGARRLAPVAILKALDGYEYQSCEHPQWESSEAREFSKALRRAMIRSLPGYDEADWHITERADIDAV